MIRILPARQEDISIIRQLAEDTWWPTYGPILAPEQIRYMLDTIYSAETMEREMLSGNQHFLLLYADNVPQGFASYGARKEEQGVYKLHKLYVLPANHGKGYGKSLIDEIISILKKQDIHLLDLNVNKYNPAKGFYEKFGFRTIREEDIPIGPYWMNDYVMRIAF